MSTTLQPLILHAHSTAPNPHKIAIALEYLNVPYTVKIWQFGNNPQKGVKGEAFLKLTPNGRVPALEDPNTGIIAWESGAIMNYLKRQYDKANILGPNGSSEQDRVDLETWEYLLLTTLAPMTGQAVWFRYYHVPKNEDALKRYTKQVYHYLEVLEGQIQKSGGQSILAGGITSVDCHFFPWVKPIEYIGISLERYPFVAKWSEFMAQQKQVKDAYQKIQDATALQDPMAASRGLQPDEDLLRQARAQAGQS